MKKDTIGRVKQINTGSALIAVDSANLGRVSVGHLVGIEMESKGERRAIGIVENISRAASSSAFSGMEYTDADGNLVSSETIDGASGHTAKIALIGTTIDAGIGISFTRSIAEMPGIDADVSAIEGETLEEFMNEIGKKGRASAVKIGKYSVSGTDALLDGDKFFQRHAALLGSTGAGKSWTVASVLESAAELPSGNVVVFDLHGEYSDLSYASHIRIPGPEDLGGENGKGGELLYLPYWLLNADELLSMLIDSTEFGAHNQANMIQKLVTNGKKETLHKIGRDDMLEAFTLDSPIPFSIEEILERLEQVNSEMVQGSRGGLKQGPHYGQFSRLISRLDGKLRDRRYGFLYSSPSAYSEYEALWKIGEQMMGHDDQAVKIIDFSEVPSDILPVIVGLVCRLIYQIQFWTDRNKRQPIALVCDEAHIYLPDKSGRNPAERRAISNFERVAKEGRKYGVSLVIVSQRPSDVNSTILSQANNIISLRLTNAEDQKIIRRLVPENMRSLVEALPVLDVGEAIVVGDCVVLPSRIKLDTPTEPPASATMDFWSRWRVEEPGPAVSDSVENMRRQGRGKR
jgi:DNA helicase HerA-like ATPase